MFTLKLRRDTALRWTNLNTILEDGEPGLELGTNLLKIGDGIKGWNELDYIIPKPVEGVELTSLPAHVDAELPHPVYDEGPSLTLLYENAKV